MTKPVTGRTATGFLSQPTIGQLIMTVKEYTLSDLESKLNEISNISVFLGTGDCPREIAYNLHDHMHEQIEQLQGMVSFMRLYPKLKAKELAEEALKLEFSNSNQAESKPEIDSSKS